MCYPAEWGAQRHGAGARAPLRRRRGRGAQGLQHHHPHRPRRRRGHASPIPALLATAAVHHHLVRAGLRTRSGLVIETGSAREVHHFALPGRLRRRGDPSQPRLRDAARHPRRPAAEDRRQGGRQALHQGDRQGPAQGDVQDGHLHLPVVLRRADLRGRRPRRERFVDKYFTGTPHGGRGHRAWRKSPKRRCACTGSRYSDAPAATATRSTPGGEYAFRIRGEAHMWTPDTIAKLQHATRARTTSPPTRNTPS